LGQEEVRNNKRSSGMEGKTSDCLSRICLYYCYPDLRFCKELFSESSEPVFVFFRWFPHGSSAACKNCKHYQI